MPKLVLKKENDEGLHRPGGLADDRDDIPQTIKNVLNLCEEMFAFIHMRPNEYLG